MLKENFLDEESGKFFEEKSLQAIQKTLSASVNVSDLELLFSELPSILKLNYPVVDEIFQSCINIIPQLMDYFRSSNLWKNFAEMNYLLEFLKTFEPYRKK